jgi:PIN domain
MTATMTAHLVPDTNLFEQCEPLHQLDWSAWTDYEEIQIFVTDPVMEEIDRHKGQGNSRVARKSRAFSSLLNEILDGDSFTKVVREANPRVVMVLCPHVTPTPDLHPSFDYSRPDHRLVGCAHALSALHQPLWLLSGDSRPKAAALTINLPRKPIPEHWLLKPERDERDKENAALRQERDRLLKAEPMLTCGAIDSQGKSIQSISGEITLFEPMAPSEVDNTIKRLEELYPSRTDFGPRERLTRKLQVPMGMRMPALNAFDETFQPATDAEISEYVDTAYPGWIEACRKRLKELHVLLQGASARLEFHFRLDNTGTRAAEHALVTFEARGNFALLAPPPAPDADELPASKKIQLPKPPPAPQGRWRSNHLGMMAGFERMVQPDNVFARPLLADLAFNPRATARDVHAFDYAPSRPDAPGRRFSISCQQWLHGTPIVRGGVLVPERTQDIMTGELVCSMRAANASRVHEQKIKVDIKVVRKSAAAEVDRLLWQL